VDKQISSLLQQATTDTNLPQGWVEGFDNKSGRAFYFSKISRRASWTRPTAEDEENSYGTSSPELPMDTRVSSFWVLVCIYFFYFF
jgi:hypothetical protein